MPIRIICPHCWAAYPVADDLRGRDVLCKECGRPVAVRVDSESPGPRRNRSPVRFFGVAVAIVLALLPAGALGALWWTGWLWDQVDWPTPPGAGPGPEGPAVVLHVAGIARSARWSDVMDDLKLRTDGGQARFFSRTSHWDRYDIHGGLATVILAPVSDPEQFARKIDFGTVHRVRGRVITVSLATGGAEGR
jgi:hypothetical protein